MATRSQPQSDPHSVNSIRSRIQEYLNQPNQEVLWNLIAELGPDPSFKDEVGDSTESDSDYENPCKKKKKTRTETAFYRKLRVEYKKRNLFTSTLSWAIPSMIAIQAIREFVGSTPIVEIGAGRGLWSHLLQMNQVTVIPTDIEAPSATFTPIELSDATTAVEKYLRPGGCLLTCWPNVCSDYATNALKVALEKDLIDKVIYIGEPEGGCTGDDEFHEIMEQHFVRIQQVEIPQWWGIHDTLNLYQKRGA